MSSHEMVQAESSAGRRSFDGFLIAFILGVTAVIGLGAGGVL